MALACTQGARADDDAATHVVLARTGPAALLLWNATPVVGALVAAHADDRTIAETLERGALRAATRELPSLANARTIEVRVLYDKTGDVSPVYGSATFAGVERYALLTLAARHVRQNANYWRNLKTTDPIPTWVTYRVIGSLPPR